MPAHDLDDPDYARFAWRRFRRILAWMTLVAALTTVVGVALVRWIAGPQNFHSTLATSAGIFFTVLLAATLMGLVFLSSGTGHDGKITDPTAPDEDDR